MFKQWRLIIKLQKSQHLFAAYTYVCIWKMAVYGKKLLSYLKQRVQNSKRENVTYDCATFSFFLHIYTQTRVTLSQRLTCLDIPLGVLNM